jgi:hypothetical protein
MYASAIVIFAQGQFPESRKYCPAGTVAARQTWDNVGETVLGPGGLWEFHPAAAAALAFGGPSQQPAAITAASKAPPAPIWVQRTDVVDPGTQQRAQFSALVSSHNSMSDRYSNASYIKYAGTALHTPLAAVGDCLLVRTSVQKEICKLHLDCPAGFYCNEDAECWACGMVNTQWCASLLGDDDCCAPDFTGRSGSCPAAKYTGVADRCAMVNHTNLGTLPDEVDEGGNDVDVILWECCLPQEAPVPAVTNT